MVDAFGERYDAMRCDVMVAGLLSHRNPTIISVAELYMGTLVVPWGVRDSISAV